MALARALLLSVARDGGGAAGVRPRGHRVVAIRSASTCREAEQLALLETLAPLYGDVEFPALATSGWRFHHENSQFPYADAILLHLLLRHWRPRRVIEIGSGFSTALMVDTVERCPSTRVLITAIEPYPERLRSVVGEFPDWLSLIELPVQEVPLTTFAELGAGDVLFIDSTHVARTGSDVVWELFEVLPRLASGVRVHFHDMCWPFEYPPLWVEQGRAWNEVYALRALLSDSKVFEIELFNHMMLSKHADWFADRMPRCLQHRMHHDDDVPGHGLWLVKR